MLLDLFRFCRRDSDYCRSVMAHGDMQRAKWINLLCTHYGFQFSWPAYEFRLSVSFAVKHTLPLRFCFTPSSLIWGHLYEVCVGIGHIPDCWWHHKTGGTTAQRQVMSFICNKDCLTSPTTCVLCVDSMLLFSVMFQLYRKLPSWVCIRWLAHRLNACKPHIWLLRRGWALL